MISDIYMATVCLEKNRWGSRQPSFRVSEWVDRFRGDGYDGIELWEFHYTSADAEEQRALRKKRDFIAMYNTYIGFCDEEQAGMKQAADAIKELDVSAVKYNLGHAPEKLEQYRRNLINWSEQIPPGCRLLCECHCGTVLEDVNNAKAFFADLDPERFGIIVHPMGDPSSLKSWIDAFPSRIAHLHIQMRDEKCNPMIDSCRPQFDDCCRILMENNYAGSLAIEFSRGIGRDEDIETIYSNACDDMAYCRSRLGN